MSLPSKLMKSKNKYYEVVTWFNYFDKYKSQVIAILYYIKNGHTIILIHSSTTNQFEPKYIDFNKIYTCK